MVNMGVVVLLFGFNCLIVEIVYVYGVLMIFDEVFMGFCVYLVGFWGL